MNNIFCKIHHRMKYGLFSAFWLLSAAANTVSGQMLLSFDITLPNCNGDNNGSATVVVAGGALPYTYLWENGETGKTILGLSGGDYVVTVTDQNGQTATDTAMVNQPDTLTVFISTTGFGCTSVVGTLKANPVGGTGPFSYLWSNFETTQQIQISTPGTYKVTVTDSKGCTAAQTHTVPPIAQFFPNFILNMPKCKGDSNGSIGVSASGTNPPFTWIWDNGTVNQGLNNIPAGTYSLTATDSKGCTFVHTVNLMDNALLIVEIMSTNIACASMPLSGTAHAAVAGGVTPYTYLWNNGSKLATLPNLPAGTYSVTVTDKNGCTAVDSTTITMPPLLSGIVTLNSPACGGNNGCATVQGTGGIPPYTYNWPALGNSNPNACELAPGDYHVLITDATNCQHDLLVTIDSIAGLNVKLVIVKADCPGVDNGMATALVTPPSGIYQYHWMPQPNPSVPQINSLPGGSTVSVTVTDANTGCIGTATAVVGWHSAVEVDVTDTDVSCMGDSTGSAIAIASSGTAPYDYVWALPGGTTVNGNTISNLAPGAYPVTVTDSKGCFAIGVADIGVLSNPIANFDFDVIECQPDSLSAQFNDLSTDQYGTITGWNWDFTWSNGGAAQSSQQTPPVIQFSENVTGVATLTITTSDGCSSTFSAPFDIMSIPEVSVNVPSVVFDCNNAAIPITVTGAAGNTYTWTPLAGLTFNPDALNVIADPSQTTDYQLIVSNGQCADTTDIQVVRVKPIQLSVPNDTIVTCDSIFTLSANANAAAGAIIVWYNSNGDTVSVVNPFTVNASGTFTYTVVATDPYGCTESDQVTLIGNSVDVNVSFDATISGCENLPLPLSVQNLDAIDNLTYQWSASSPNLSIVPQGGSSVTVTGPAGTYTVTVTVANQFDCVREFVTQITLEPSAVLDGLIFADLCHGLTVSFQNTSGITGLWNFGDDSTSTELNPVHIYNTDGVYTVTYTSVENCVIPFDTVITVLPEAAVQAAISSNYVDCSQQTEIQFTDESVHSNPTVNWKWTFTPGNQTSGDQNPLITFTQEGLITAMLTVTDVNGCFDTASIQVQIMYVNDTLGEEAMLCPGMVVALNPDSSTLYGYNWISQPADPNLDPADPNPEVSPLVATVYTVTIVNGPCTVVDSITVTPQPAATVELPDNQLVCSDDLVTIQAQNTNGVNFTWSDSPDFTPVLSTSDSLVVVPVKNGTYYILVENASGCLAVDSVKVNNAKVNVEGEPANKTICLGESTELTITNLDQDDNLTYTWAPVLDPIPNPVVTPASSTDYSVEIINQFGCKDTLAFSVDVISISVTAEVTGKDTICPGQSTELLATVTSNSNDITYQWTPSSSLTGANTANPTAEPMENTQYIVTATAAGLCPDTASVTVFFMTGECVEPYIFVPKAFTPNNDGNNEFFIVRGVNITELYFVVWDRWGEKVFETTNPLDQGWDGTFDGKELTPDSYAWYVRVTCGNGETYVNKGDVTLLK